MAVEIKKKPGESTEGMIRRFQQNVTKSGLIRQVKGGRFMSRTPNKRVRRVSALRRKADQVKRAYLIKIGTIKS